VLGVLPTTYLHARHLFAARLLHLELEHHAALAALPRRHRIAPPTTAAGVRTTRHPLTAVAPHTRCTRHTCRVGGELDV
jgi:hypothetical protein